MTSISIALFVTILVISCGTEPEARIEFVPAFVARIDSIITASRTVTVHGIGSSECMDDVFGNYKLTYTSDSVSVSLNSKRVGDICLDAFASYNVEINIPVDKGGTYTIRLPYGYREYLDTVVVIPD